MKHILVVLTILAMPFILIADLFRGRNSILRDNTPTGDGSGAMGQSLFLFTGLLGCLGLIAIAAAALFVWFLVKHL